MASERKAIYHGYDYCMKTHEQLSEAIMMFLNRRNPHFSNAMSQLRDCLRLRELNSQKFPNLEPGHRHERIIIEGLLMKVHHLKELFRTNPGAIDPFSIRIVKERGSFKVYYIDHRGEHEMLADPGKRRSRSRNRSRSRSRSGNRAAAANSRPKTFKNRLAALSRGRK